jgi:Concanavalin A-like lectin/glucanases superfamily
MKSIPCEENGPDRGSLAPGLWAVAVVLTAAGCIGDNRPLPAEQSDEQLAALMADEELPDPLKPAPTKPPPPPRFCGGFDGKGGGPGGSFPVEPGMPLGGPVPPPPPPPPTAGTAGSGGLGGAGGVVAVDAGAAPDTAATDGGSGMAGRGGLDGGQGGSDPSCASVPIGMWTFDDCNTFRADLQDSSFQGHTAFRSVDLVCQEGQEGQAVSFSSAGDLVYVPDQPAFALDDGVTVAAWINPDKLGGVRTIFRKRDGLNSSFALVINGEKLQFIIRLDSGRFATVSTAAEAGQWTHVAATYDNEFLRLYVDGTEVRHTQAPGKIARGVGPLLMGNDVLGRRFDGRMDSAWFNTMAAPAATVLELTCLRHDATAAVTPAVGPAVAAGTPVTFQLAITNHNGPTCAAVSFQSFVSFREQGFTADPTFISTAPAATGETVTVPVSIASGEDTEPGNYPITFIVFGPRGPMLGNFIQASAEYVVAEPAGCHVSSSRELTIRDVSVVDDAVRTSLDGDSQDPRTGAWTFGRMMERLSPRPEDAPDVTEAMFRTFLATQTINGFAVEPRPAMDPVVLAPWPRRPDGKLDLARAPMRLLAIVNRLDLQDLARGKGGEGRMVYGVLDRAGNQMEFTVILEYLLPAANDTELRGWTDSFHALQALSFPSEEYNAALQAITDRFTGRNAVPSMPNGSALIDVRTNEIALSFVWQLREFHLSPTTGFLDPATLALTPDQSFNGSARLGRFINANEAAVVAETHEVPATFEDQPFQAGAVFNNIDAWDAPGIKNPEARHKLSLNTCNGCHGGETNTRFLQIGPRSPGQPSSLSGFLTGTTVFDRFSGQQRRFNELARRRQLLESIVCAPGQP